MKYKQKVDRQRKKILENGSYLWIETLEVDAKINWGREKRNTRYIMHVISSVKDEIFIHNFSCSETVKVTLTFPSGCNSTKEVYSLICNKLQVMKNNRSKLSL
jgi:hypothetical protein